MRLGFLLFFFALPAWAVGPSWPLADMPRFWILGEGNAHFSIDGFYSHSKENYDADGRVNSPATMEHVRYGNMRFHVGFGFAPQVSVFAQADLRAVFEKNAQGTNISDSDNYGFGDGFVGMRWLLYRSKSTDRVYPSEWAPETWLALAETTWLFPLYAQAKPGKPPLGEQSNDFTVMGRLVWYANEWLGLAGGGGYTHRTSGYRAGIPWSLRADLNFLQQKNFRFWLDFQSFEALKGAGNVLNPTQPDPLPGGSLLFKSEAPTVRSATLGLGYLLSKEWEIAAGALLTASGINTAKGFGGALGLAWRPYQMPELRYEEYRRNQLRKLEQEPMSYRRREVLRYGFQATVLRVSGSGNFFQIGFGKKDGVKAGDSFQVFAPDDFSGSERTPIALAVVKVSRAEDSFLRIEQRYEREIQVKPGFEARRVIFTE
jgi:hypothetical protein